MTEKLHEYCIKCISFWELGTMTKHVIYIAINMQIIRILASESLFSKAEVGS
jgi:hypothetical protein